MKIAGLIAEYNPFHHGHLHHLKESKRITGANYTVVVMSGDFVQRGSPSIVDKYTRTKMALKAGVDLVLELPTRYATGSAEFFAAGAVCLLNNLGIVDALCFGSESGDIKSIIGIAKILTFEPDNYQSLLRKSLAQGLSFPAAREVAMADYFTNGTPLLDGPNNILALEYCKALLRYSSSIEPVTIKRKDSHYKQTELSATFSSATAIRHSLERENSEHIWDHIPDNCRSILEEVMEKEGIITSNDYSLLLKCKLLGESHTSLEKYQDLSSEIATRILSHLDDYTTYTDFIKCIKTKDLTYSRVSRTLLHILLNIKSYSLPPSTMEVSPYAHILGFREESSVLLNAIKINSSIPLISKLANRRRLLNDNALILLDEDIFAANLYQTVSTQKSGARFYNEITRSPIIL